MHVGPHLECSGWQTLVSLVLGQAHLVSLVLGHFQKMVGQELELPAGLQEEWLAPLALNDLGLLDC